MNSLKTMEMVLILLLVAGVVSGACAADQSQTGQPGQPAPKMKCQERFYALDADRDGVISGTEFMNTRRRKSRAEEVFKSKDTNGDGGLTQDELCPGRRRDRAMGKQRLQ